MSSDERPDDVFARIDLTNDGIRFNLKEGMSREAVVRLLRTLADAFEQDEIERVK